MPSGASTADRDLWQLITFCSLQVLDRTFYLHVLVCVVFFACFCIYLHVLDVFRLFVSCQRGLGTLQMLLQKSNHNPKKIMPDFIQIHPKSIKNPCKIHPKPITLVARTDPKATLRAIPQVIIPQGVFGSNFWRHLGDFGRHFGHRRVPRGCQNRAFWHQGASKVGNMRSGKRCWKKIENLTEF